MTQSQHRTPSKLQITYANEPWRIEIIRMHVAHFIHFMVYSKVSFIGASSPASVPP